MNLTELHKRILTALVLLPIVIYLILFTNILFLSLLILILLVSSYEWYNLNRKKISTTFILGIIIISLSIFFIHFLKSDNQKDTIILLWVFFVCIFSDIGGYFFGKIIGGKKITKISPNKTYSGMFGSFIFSIFPILIFYFLKDNFLFFSVLILNFKNIILSLLFSLVCQLGDIAVSYIKRKNRFKDTSDLLPGHGGLLDRIDGLIFVMIFSGFLKIIEVI